MTLNDAHDVATPLHSLDLDDETATAALGARLAAVVAAGDVLALSGDLGAGKTTLARGLIRALAPDATVASPTYTLTERHDAGAFEIAHFDFYRLENEAEIRELGVEEAMENDLVIIEWPERAPGVLTADALIIRLVDRGGARRAVLYGDADWRSRLVRAGIIAG